jgi:hypothetical protein
MASAAQVHANQANAQHSRGPVTEEGKARVSQNRLIHGLTGQFAVASYECPDQFKQFSEEIQNETKPQNTEEQRLVDAIIQHYWLVQRALSLQSMLMFAGDLDAAGEKRLALYIRYQTTNERSYYKARTELQNLRKQKRAEEIGFESQKGKEADEVRKQEAHEARVRLTNARAVDAEIENEARLSMEAPLPGHSRIAYSDIHDACAAALRTIIQEQNSKAAA